MKLTDTQFTQLHLFRCGGVGPIIYKQLLTEYGSAEKALQNLHRHKRNLEFIPEQKIQLELANLEKIGAMIVFTDSTNAHTDNFPPLLRHIDGCPPLLTVLGDPSYLTGKQIAIVGNRNASSNAMRFTENLAIGLAEQGLTITSGMARGIDTAAHRGAINTKAPTIAVLAGGIDHIYPPENRQLYEKIAENGCIISEMAIGMAPTSQHFPRRNRIISGMALGTAVIEAAKRSGSLITARYALEQGREVFAMPGSPADPRSSGPNHLIKEGAIMMESADDILKNLPTNFTPAPPPPENLDMFADNGSADINMNNNDDSRSDTYSKSNGKSKKRNVYTDKNTARTLKNPNKTPSVYTTKNDVPTTEPPAPTEPSEIIKSLLSSQPTELDEIIRRSGLPQSDVLITLTELDILGEIERSADGGVVLK